MSENISAQARTKELPCKPAEEQNQRLTSRTKSALRPGCWLVCRRLFVFAKPFHARHVRGSIYLFRHTQFNPKLLSGWFLECFRILSGFFGSFRVWGFFRILLTPFESVQVLFRFFRVLSSPRCDLSSKRAVMSLKLLILKSEGNLLNLQITFILEDTR